jgi:hypothetical protein
VCREEEQTEAGGRRRREEGRGRLRERNKVYSITGARWGAEYGLD